jgi:hypothetical protein
MQKHLVPPLSFIVCYLFVGPKEERALLSISTTSTRIKRPWGLLLEVPHEQDGWTVRAKGWRLVILALF